MSELLSPTINEKREISLPNPFDYNSRKQFLPLIKGNLDNIDLVLDFNGVETLDSSALGMLLMARERVGGIKSRISLINCSDRIRKILTVAQFHMLFRMV
jgi:HptB-dependent secretion and biofilm anti anti-sigma factor